MSPRLAPEEMMTIEEFLAFTDTRPDDERWELIEGAPIMQASPTDIHQTIAGNISAVLCAEKRRLQAPWHALLGIGTRVPISPKSLPLPDVMVKEHPATGDCVSDDGLALFEVFAKSSTKADRRWRLGVYRSVPNCQRYVTAEQTFVRVVRYDRATDWKPVPLESLEQQLDLPALGAVVPLAEIYWDTPLARKR